MTKRKFYIILLISILNYYCLSADKEEIEKAQNALKFNNFTQAIELYTGLINTYSEYAPFFYGRGMAYYYLDNNNDAAIDFQKAISFDSNYFDAYLGLTYTLLHNGNNKKSLELIEKAIQINPKSSNAFYTKGLINYLDKKYKNSIEDFSIAIKLDTTNVSAIYGRAIAYYQLKDYENAKIDFDTFIMKTTEFVELKMESERLLKTINDSNNK
jgi:tetratricopeptide (TPR) repeat protein